MSLSTVVELNLSLAVSVAATGWQTALNRGPSIKLRGLDCLADRPAVVSMVERNARVKTFGYAFPDARAEAKPTVQQKGGATTPGAAAGIPTAPPTGATRMRPPSDVIKLVDRLYYVLQPPLETLINAESLNCPFDPFPYQLEGIAFLYPRHAAMLADEMGLGKTMQAITTIRLLLCAAELRRVLLICPKPLVSNWKREFGMWAPEVPLVVVEGDRVKRRWQWELPAAPVTIANYELLMRDRDIVCDPALQFDLVVLDEAQRIKNRNSTTSQVVREIHRRRSWAITGTPVENSPDDLVGIFEFVAPGYLRREMQPRRLAVAVGDHVLRRTKDMVLTDLPPKLFRDAQLNLTSSQSESYRMAEDAGVLRLSDMGHEATIQHVFELVLRLKQICNFDPVSGESSKLERLVADLEEVTASGKKAIVFSQWVETLLELKRRLAGFQPLEYHGRIPTRQRDMVIERFRNDPGCSVMLMSYGAGSVGLNLQFASYVFLFDRWWNPAVEDQAINRAHRIGSAGPVTVSRFLTVSTIEERIDQVLEQKREMFDVIFAPSQRAQPSGLTQAEIFGLFNLRSPSGRLGHVA